MFSGCKILPPPPPPTAESPDAVMARLKARQAGLQSFEAKGRLTLLSPQRNFSGTGLIKGNLPTSLRLDLLDPLGRTAASFFSDGSQMQVFFPRENKLLVGEATPANLGAFLPPGVTLPQVLRLLTGDLPLSPEAPSGMRPAPDQEAYVLEWRNPDGSLKERLWVSTRELAPIKDEWYDTDGRHRFTAELGDFGRLVPDRPQTITVKTIQPAVELRLAFREFKLNAPMSPGDLTLPRPPGVVEEPLGR
jgi:outer membrane lipoprotein-sorting protein